MPECLTCVQYLEVDIPCDKHHINQHRDTVLYMETYSNIEVKVGEILDVIIQVTSQKWNKKEGRKRMDGDSEDGAKTSNFCP